MKYKILIFYFLLIAGCHTPDKKQIDQFLTREIPTDSPICFTPELTPQNLIVHRGIFSNDLSEYYFTVSDTVFSNFEIKVCQKKGTSWTTPVNASFNSQYNDHGMSFSPDGNTLIFSSTRPVGIDSIPNTWHIWKCEKRKGQWSKPEFVNIPNLTSRLTSHPTLSTDGTLYFHASDLDYSNMTLYYSTWMNGKYQEAKRLDFVELNAAGYCTPYISSDGQHLIFAAIGENLELYVASKKGDNNWSQPVKLPESINKNGQGNPYLTPDSKYLFFASEYEGVKWCVNWVSTASFLPNEKLKQ